MENAWLSLNLEVDYAHPLNRGWMDVFHRWTNARTVRANWPLVRSEFGRSFVGFCETQMRLGAVAGRAVPLGPGGGTPPLLARLLREFADQWPAYGAWLPEALGRLREMTAWSVTPETRVPLPDTRKKVLREP